MVRTHLIRPTLVILAGIMASFGLWWSYPDTQDLATVTPKATAFSRAAKATLSEYVPFDDFSGWLVCAAIVAEDGNFLNHAGWDARATFRSALRWLFSHRGPGGSTITQQLARNLFLAKERTALRKVREIRLAVSLERHLTKQRILELYLNVVQWGPKLWGVAAASEELFGKRPKELNHMEAVALVALLPAPATQSEAVIQARCVSQQRILALLRWRRLLGADEWQLSRVSLLEICRTAPTEYRVGLARAEQASGTRVRHTAPEAPRLPCQE